jgi:hypothetical protein
MDYKVEIWLVPMNHGFEPQEEKAILRSATCVSDLDHLMTVGQGFLEELPAADNHTTWK